MATMLEESSPALRKAPIGTSLTTTLQHCRDGAKPPKCRRYCFASGAASTALQAAGNDAIVISLDKNPRMIDVSINGKVSRFGKSNIKKLSVSGGNGNDRITLALNITTLRAYQNPAPQNSMIGFNGRGLNVNLSGNTVTQGLGIGQQNNPLVSAHPNVVLAVSRGLLYRRLKGNG